MGDFAVSELRRIDLFFRNAVTGKVDSTPTSYFMHESQVDDCIKVFLEWHYLPNRNALPTVMIITVGKLFGGLLGWSSNRVWVHPDVRRKEADTQPDSNEVSS